MEKSRNGMIVFLRDQKIPGPVMLDIEITNAFPLIALSEQTILISPDGKKELLSGYDHLSIPPDFRLHLSGPKEHIFFDANPIWDLIRKPNNQLVHYFTIIGLPSKLARELIPPGKTRTWGPSMIISPFKDAEYNDSTRVFVDFFLHSSEMAAQVFSRIPPVMSEMRLVGEKDGFVIGPHSYGSLQRKKTNDRDLFITMRYGYIDLDDEEVTYIYTPLGIFQKRARN